METDKGYLLILMKKQMLKYLIMDIDGSLTDGKIYMGTDGEVMKAFSVKDGYAVNFILKPAGITPVVLTARNSSIVQKRCEELGITDIYQGIINKVDVVKEIVGEYGLGSCAFFGDDILDMKCMLPIKEAGGIAGCPADAVKEVKAVADYICINKAGEGAFREFAEWLTSDKADENEIERRVKEAVDFINQLKISSDDAGKKVVVNDYFSYSVQRYETKAEKECKLESHRKNIDIQKIFVGVEAMDVADISRLSIKEDYSEENDVMFWNVPQHISRVKLSEDDLIVLYPENAHRGAISFAEKNNVLKVVGKVKAY